MDTPAVDLKVVMNIGRLGNVILVMFVAYRLALNLTFVENMLADIIWPSILTGFEIRLSVLSLNLARFSLSICPFFSHKFGKNLSIAE